MIFFCKKYILSYMIVLVKLLVFTDVKIPLIYTDGYTCMLYCLFSLFDLLWIFIVWIILFASFKRLFFLLPDFSLIVIWWNKPL